MARSRASAAAAAADLDAARRQPRAVSARSPAPTPSRAPRSVRIVRSERARAASARGDVRQPAPVGREGQLVELGPRRHAARRTRGGPAAVSRSRPAACTSKAPWRSAMVVDENGRADRAAGRRVRRCRARRRGARVGPLLALRAGDQGRRAGQGPLAGAPDVQRAAESYNPGALGGSRRSRRRSACPR